AYEHICMKNNKKALQYETQAVKLCEEITATNPHLAANIYGNIGGLYHADKQLEKAKQYMELAYHTLVESGMEFTNDSVIQICNYANLAANMGEPLKAIKALKRCAEGVKQYNSEYSSDYANLVWDMGCIYLQMQNTTKAADCFKSALNIYNIVWENEPELLQTKIEELRKMLQALCLDYTALIK
ncbi:MAG: tetratricopeptide repeat protein, partial [bacterium]|nr:tetratricopeptide repeat protein [bacterium]